MNLWFIPPRVLTLDILRQEFNDTSKLFYQIADKYEKNRFDGNSPLMRRFYRYQPYVFLRNKIVAAQILHETGKQQVSIPKSIIRFGLSYYEPSERLIQEQCEEVYDYWQSKNNTEKLSEFSILTTNEIRKELKFLFEIYKQKYEL